MDKEVYIRDAAYLDEIRGQSCLSCLQPGEAHHLMRAQERGMGLRTGDNWAVPLCHRCHMVLHFDGNESIWWAMMGIDAIQWATDNWNRWIEQRKG